MIHKIATPLGPISLTSGSSVEGIADFLARVGTGLGERKLKAAAALLRRPDPPKGGRPAIYVDDGALVAEARWMVEQGRAKSLHGAFAALARTQTRDEQQIRSIVERLRRKNAALMQISPTQLLLSGKISTHIAPHDNGGSRGDGKIERQ